MSCIPLISGLNFVFPLCCLFWAVNYMRTALLRPIVDTIPIVDSLVDRGANYHAVRSSNRIAVCLTRVRLVCFQRVMIPSSRWTCNSVHGTVSAISGRRRQLVLAAAACRWFCQRQRRCRRRESSRMTKQRRLLRAWHKSGAVATSVIAL